MRGLIGIGIGIGVIVAVTLAVVALSANRDPTTFPPGSPEATLQAYLRALEAGDSQTAYDLLSSQVRQSWSADQFEQVVDEYQMYNQAQRLYRVTEVDQTGDRANLRVTVEVLAMGGVGTDRYTSQAEVRMIREEDSWWIDAPMSLELYEFGPPAPPAPGPH